MNAEILQQQPCADPGTFKNDGQPAARMGSTPDEIHAIEVLEPVVRPEVQHLPEIVGHAERRAAIDRELPLPVERRDNPLEAHWSEPSVGKASSETLNGLDQDTTRIRKKKGS